MKYMVQDVVPKDLKLHISHYLVVVEPFNNKITPMLPQLKKSKSFFEFAPYNLTNYLF